MKKIITLVFVLSLFFIGQSVFATSLWNGASDDCPSIAIANFTTTTGYVYPCWPLTSVNANPDEYVNIRIYYHNSSDLFGSGQTATNVRIKLNANTINNSVSSHSFSGQIISDQGNISFGPVYANLSTPKKLTLGSTRWYPNQGTSYTESGSQVLSSNGLSIGSIAPGWATQGSVVVSFKVDSSTPPPPPPPPLTMTGTLNANSSSCVIPTGNNECKMHFTWNVINPASASSAVTKDGFGTVATGSSGSDYFSIKYGSNLFRLYNSSIQLDSETVNGVCDSGSSWDGSFCKLNNNNNNNCSISYFKADGSNSSTTIDEGDPAYLTWSTNNCSSANISYLGSVNLSGGQNVYPSYDRTYTLTAYNYNGNSVSKSVTVYVDDYVNNNTCSIDSFYTSHSSINFGSSATLYWDTNNCNSVYLSGFGNVNSDGSRVVYPNGTTNYTLTAHGQNGGNQIRTVQVNVSSYNYIQPTPIVTPVYYGACAVTAIASNVTQNSAVLNGVVSNPSYTNTNTYFEYGTTTNLGYKTATRTISGSSSFSETISGLSPGTTYYFRLVSNCSTGSPYGNISTLKTASNIAPAVITPVYQNVINYIGTGTSSPIQLKIENRFEFVARGDDIDYVITYKNIGKTTLKDPVIQVVVPRGIFMKNASEGTFSNENHILTVPLQDLVRNAEGVIYLDAQVNSIPLGTEKFVTTAVLVYTNPSKVQESATAYVLNIPKNNNSNLSALVLFGYFLPGSLIGWLLLLLIILIIILVTRRYIVRR